MDHKTGGCTTRIEGLWGAAGSGSIQNRQVKTRTVSQGASLLTVEEGIVSLGEFNPPIAIVSFIFPGEGSYGDL